LYDQSLRQRSCWKGTYSFHHILKIKTQQLLIILSFLRVISL
jgi:hypothetical protein